MTFRRTSASRRLGTGVLAASLVHAVQLLFLQTIDQPVSLAFFASHALAVGAFQIVAALFLGSWREQRAWAAAVFLVPTALAGMPFAVGLAGTPGIAALVGASLLAGALWLRWGPAPGAPLPASVLGAIAAAELLRFRHEHFQGFHTDAFWVAWIGAVGLFALLGAAYAGRLPRLARLPRAPVAVAISALVFALALLPAVPRSRPPEPQPAAGERSDGPPLVVLIVLDTVRADHLASYGYSRDTMPELETFLDRHEIPARHSVATSPWTLPTHGSIFTGLYPPRHGAQGAAADAPNPPPGYIYPLRKDVPTLAGLLGDSGYRTVGIVANYSTLAPEFGFARGFDVYRALPSADHAMKKRTPWSVQTKHRHPLQRVDALPPFASAEFFGPSPSYRRAGEIVEEAARVLDTSSEEEPLFLFLNFLDPHAPYLPPNEYRARYPGRDPELPVPGLAGQLKERLYLKGGSVTPSQKDHMTSLYDGELAYLDAQLGRLLRRLEADARWDDTLLVITSDHGEAFGENGVLTHRSSLYREQLRVPLFVKTPGARSRPWGEVVSSVDLFATVLDYAGAPIPEGTDGRPRAREREELRAWLRSFQEEFAKESPERFGGSLRSIQRGRWKLIETSGERVELYDLERDPKEEQDRAHHRDRRVERLRRRLAEVPRRAPEGRPEGSLSEETRRGLRALGYVR